MPETVKAAVAVIGIDIGKTSFHVVGLNQRGAIVLRQRWSRGQVETRFANMPPCLIGMEACVRAHHLSRRLKALGHDARLMPAKYVRPAPNDLARINEPCFSQRSDPSIGISQCGPIQFADPKAVPQQWPVFESCEWPKETAPAGEEGLGSLSSAAPRCKAHPTIPKVWPGHSFGGPSFAEDAPALHSGRKSFAIGDGQIELELVSTVVIYRL